MNTSQTTLREIRAAIAQHTLKLKLLTSKTFQFAQTASNLLDLTSEELASKLQDTIDALKRRSIKVQQIESSMEVKMRTMLD